MPIERIRPDPIRSQDPRPTRGTDGPEGDGPAPIRGTEAAGRVDRIEISSEGRLLAAQFEATRPEAEELAPAQVEAIQQRIASGIYDSSEIVEAVARKIIERGDL